MRPTTPATSAARRHCTGRMTDGTGDRNTALCCLTPTPRTKWRGGSSPGPCSLGISMKAQLFILRLVQDLPTGPRTYCSFSTSTEAGLVPHPRRLRLNHPSGEPFHPFKCAWPHLVRQPRLAGYSNRGDGTAVQSPFLPSPTDGAGVTVPCGHTLRTFPPKPGTTLTTKTPALYTGHLRGLGTISYSTRQASALHQVKNPQGTACLLQWRPY